MKIISLKSFVESGKFGNIGIGSLKTDVINELGSDFDYYDSGETEIVKYGWYEFFFWCDTGKLFGIQNDHLQADCSNHDEMILFQNDKFEVDTWFLKVDESFKYEEVIELLKKEQVQYQIVIGNKYEPEIIKFASNVYFDFSEGVLSWNIENNNWLETTIEKKEEFLLNGIRIFDLKRG